MLLTVYIIAILSGLLFKKSKAVTFLIATVMYIISAYRTYDADYNSYLISYNLLGSGDGYRYAGYTWLQRIFYNAGASFEQYNKVFSLIVILMMLYGISLLTKNINQVLSCYLVFSFPLDVVQMKTALANAMVLIGIALVLTMRQGASEKELWLLRGKRRRLIGLVLLVLSCFIHFSSIYYVLAIVVTQVIKNRRGVAIHMLALLSTICVLLYSGLLVILVRYAGLLNVVGDLDYIARWTTRVTRYGFLIYIIPILAAIFLCPRTGFRDRAVDSAQHEIATFQITSVLLIPLLMLNGQYSRLIRIYMLMMYIYQARSVTDTNILDKRITIQSLSNLLASCAAIGILFYFDIFLNYDLVLGAILSYNSLIS